MNNIKIIKYLKNKKGAGTNVFIKNRYKNAIEVLINILNEKHIKAVVIIQKREFLNIEHIHLHIAFFNI